MPEPLDPTTLDLATDPELGPLLAACPDIVPLRFLDEEHLVTEGADCRDLYIVRKGSLVVEKALPDGTQRPLAQLECTPESPAIIGEMAYFGALRRTATVRAVGSCQALHLNPGHLDVIMAGFPGLTRVLCRQFTTRLMKANKELREVQIRLSLAPERRMVQPGESIYAAGEPSDAVYQLAMGTVCRQGEGEPQLLRPDDLPGGFLDLRAFLLGLPHTESVRAEETCFLAVISADRREALLRNYPAEALAALG